MAVPRPVLLVILGALLAGTALFATRGARESEDSGTATPATQSATPPAATKEQPKQSKGEQVSTPNSGKSKSQTNGSKAAEAGLPPKVERALQQKRVLVLFFHQPGAADDDATAEAVSSLKGDKKLAIFRDNIKNVGSYSKIVAGVGVSQAPSIVIVGSDRRARLVEGYVDAETLEQHVADVR